jgi:ketosteroid isomerase-like protein
VVHDERPPRLAAARQLLHHLSRGDATSAMGSLSPGVRVVVPGRSDLAGDFRGRDQVAGHLLRLVATVSDTIEALKWEDVMEGDQHVAALLVVHAQRPGHVYQGRHLYLLSFDPDDRIAEIHLFPEDQGAFDRFLAG